MQGLTPVQARALARRVLQHVRVIPLFDLTRQDSSLASSTLPPTQNESLEEHGLPKGLRKFLKTQYQGETLAISDSKLGKGIRDKLEINYINNAAVAELMRG